MARRTDEQILLDLVPSDRPVGNTVLRRQLAAWSEEKYWRVRDQLIDKGLLAAGRGYGGSVRRTGERAAPAPETGEADTGGAPPDSTPIPAEESIAALKHIRFLDWKSFHDATLYLDPLTVLIGANASGKSNALDGLQFLNRTALGKELGVALGGDPTLSPLRGGVEWASIQGTSRFTLEVSIRAEEPRTEYVYAITVDTQPRVQLAGESLKRIRRRKQTDANPYELNLLTTDRAAQDSPSITARLYNGKSGTRKDGLRSASLLSQLVGLPLPQEVVTGLNAVSKVLRNIFILDPIPSGMRGYSPFAESLRTDAANTAGVLAALSEPQKAKVEATLTRYIRDLPERDVRKVWAEPVGRFRTDAMLYCEEAWVRGGPSTTIDARGMSDGTLRMLAILTALLTRPEGSVLVIEEVDNGLHPSRSHLLLRMLREVGEARKIDVLVTTHNPALLDALGPTMVPFVLVAHRDSETGESLLTLLEDIENLPKLMAGGSLGTLSARGQIEQSLDAGGRAA
ncbi:MAG: ATP-binding protein [Byssovorax sp.]